MSLTLDKQNAYRQQYAELIDGWQPATKVYEQKIRQYLQPELRVLDVGCGRGGVFEQLGDAVSHPVGIDPDVLSLIEHRMTALPRAGAISDDLPFMSGAFDMVLSSWVLEHLATPKKTFSETARVLKTGGYFIFITPNKNSFITLLNRIAKPLQSTLVPMLYGRDEADTFPVTYRANTLKDISALASENHFEIIDLFQIKDPTYLAFHPILFRLNVWLSQVTPASMAEHLVGILKKK